MRVHLYPADDQGCGFYRMREPGRIAQAEGVTVNELEGVLHEMEADPLKGVTRRLLPVEADVVVLQRPLKGQYAGWVPEFQKQGVAVVVEIDDDLSNIHPNSPAYKNLTGRGDPDVHWRNAMRAANQADLVTCTSAALAERFAPHGRVAILPNCVPEWLCDVPRASDGKTLGYSGAIYFHWGDLEVTHGGIQAALDGTDWRFLKIGGGAEICERRFGLSERPDQTGALTIGDFHPALAKLDIGVAPLADNVFNRAKSYLKGIEYAAAGVPFVASAMPEYEALAAEGLGVVVPDRGRNWKSALRKLMTDDALRQEQSERGRELVRQRHTYEANGYLWIEAWQEAISNREAAQQRRGRVAA